MTDSEFAAWLRSLPRERSPEEVERAVRFRDDTLGEYFPHGRVVHHSSQEARH